VDGQGQAPTLDENRQMIGMSFAPQTFGGHEDYQSESNANNGQGTSKILGAAGIQVPQTFMSKYQAQLLDSQK